MAIYVSQELLEGLFATGHPGGVAGIFGYGGWWSIPAALAVGLVLAAMFYGASWVLDAVASDTASAPATARQPALKPAAPMLRSPRLPRSPGGWSGRGPPG